MSAATPVRVWAVDISAWVDTKSTADLAALADELLGAGSAASKKVTSFYRVPDKIRALAGQLLPRILYAREGCSWGELTFSKTREGRPFLAIPSPTLDYNVTHDGDWVALAACPAAGGVRVGVDVMRVALPRYEPSVGTFLQSMETALTPAELSWIRSVGELPPAAGGILSRTEQAQPRAPLNERESEALQRLFYLWTHKEAISKNLGAGLGFDFSLIEVALWRVEEVLTLRTKSDKRYEFIDIHLLPGGTPNTANTDLHASCQLVVAHGPLDLPPATCLNPPMTATAAAEAGILTVISMDQLVAQARELTQEKRSTYPLS